MNKDGVIISKKWFYIGIATILIVIIFLAFALIKGNYKVKFSTDGAEFTPLSIEKDSTAQESRTIQKPEPSSVDASKATTKRKATVKSGDTTITVEDQPAIINMGQNNGVMGNNNNITVQTNVPQRHLNDAVKPKLLSLVDQVFKQNNKNSDYCIQVSTANRTPESEKYAVEVSEFLKANSYNVNADIGVVMIATRIKGIQIQPIIRQKCVDIWVGNE